MNYNFFTNILILLFFVSPQFIVAQINTFDGTYLSSSQPGCPSGNELSTSSNIAFEDDVIFLLNEFRATLGLPPLKKSEDLRAAARYHATDMINSDYFAHDSQDGYGNITCSAFSRIGAFYTWNAAAENIAAGYTSPEDVLEGWINSPGHYSNLISTIVNEIGMGYKEGIGVSYGNRWVMDLGRSTGNYPIIINNEQLATDNNQVDLYIYSNSAYNEMRFKTNDGNWTAWEPYCETKSFTMEVVTAGTHIVYVERRNATGNTNTACDEIILSTDIETDTGGSGTPSVLVQASAFLEGNFNSITNNMNTILASENLIPNVQPFASAPWNYSGSETISSMPANMVDWVLLEVRSTNSNHTLIEQKAAMLLNDGNIIGVNGETNGVYFYNLTAGNSYHIAIKTRNHLAVISASEISLPNSNPYNFANANVIGGNEQMALVAPDIYALRAGDFDSNGIITIADYNFMQTEMSLINDYLTSDCNLDRTVTVADYNFYAFNTSVIGAPPIRY